MDQPERMNREEKLDRIKQLRRTKNLHWGEEMNRAEVKIERNKPGRRKRLLAVDILRGLTLLSMIGFHGMWDAVWLFGVHAPWYLDRRGYVWQQSICWTFILLSGFSFRLGRRHLKRGLTVFLCGAAVTAVTLIFMPEDRVLFGVLTCIGSCMLLMIPFDRWIEGTGKEKAVDAGESAKAIRADAVSGPSGADDVSGKSGVPGRGMACGSAQANGVFGLSETGDVSGKVGVPGSGMACGSAQTTGNGMFSGCAAVVGFFLSALLFFLTRNINRGTLGFEGISFCPLPAGLYRNLFTAYFGFPAADFFSTDYFSLFPWFFLFCCGYFVRRMMEGREAARTAAESETLAFIPASQKSGSPEAAANLLPVKILTFLGRHTLPIYMLHQPLLMAFFLLIFRT